MAVDARAAKPFGSPPYDLGPGLSLDAMTPAEAIAAGTLCAAIEPWSCYPLSRDHLIAFFALIDPAAPRFALKADGTFAGSICVRRDWLLGPYIAMLAVAPAVQGRGLGSRMLAWTEAHARLNRDRNLWIAVSDFNTGAQRLYTRHGFTRAAELDGLIRDGRNEILMRKRLS